MPRTFKDLRIFVILAIAMLASTIDHYVAATSFWCRATMVEPVLRVVEASFTNEQLLAAIQRVSEGRKAAALAIESMWLKLASRIDRSFHRQSPFVARPVHSLAAL